MHTYVNEELNEKITTFLDRKTERFPDLRSKQDDKSHDPHYISVESIAEKIHSIWYKQLHA